MSPLPPQARAYALASDVTSDQEPPSSAMPPIEERELDGGQEN